MTIDDFRGRWTKLGNYSSCVIFYEKHAYQSVEHAYQAAKFTEDYLRKFVRDAATPAVAKRVARELATKGAQRKDWMGVNTAIMYQLLCEKFAQEPERAILLSTGDAVLIEGNWWHDNYWGDCRCGREQCKAPGQNKLGNLLTQVRNELSEGARRDGQAE